MDESYEVITSASDYSTKTYATGSTRYVIDLAPGKYEMDLWTAYAGDNDYTISFQYKSANETYKMPNNMYIDVMSEQEIHFSKKITAKKSGGISGYEVRYKKGSASWKKTTVNGNKNLSKTIKNLKPGSYKVQVRSYCKVSGKKYYSDWTKAKSVKLQ